MSGQVPPIPSKAVASTSKAATTSGQSSPAGSQTQLFSNDSGQRRSGSSGGNARSSSGARNQQGSKPKHKQGKKFRPLDEDGEAELYSMQNPHNRKGQTSITHLMNFSLPPRPQQNQYHRHNYNGPRRGGRANPTWGLGSGYHSVDKARYIHANYRFIVDPRGDYSTQAADADVHLDWNNVLQIIASAKTQTASCPICLGEPTAPRMAKCGHIFCLPCLIRYMHSEDGNGPPPEKKARWKKCPICWDSIYISETRPVRWYVGQESDPPHEGSDVVLRLVRRKPGQTLAMPRESAESVPRGEDIPWYFAAEVMDYARVMRGSEDYMNQQYDEALEAVEMLQREDELMFGEDAEWTGRAKRMLNEAKEKVKGMGNAPEQPKKPEQEAKKLERPPIQFNENDDGVPDMYLQQHADEPAMSSTSAPSSEQETNDVHTTDNAIPRTLHEMRRRQTDKPQPAEYLFYQGLLHFYLSPLDIRILKTAFGSYSSFPSSILPRVERVSSGHIVDDELRKRVKYLAHLPYGCEVGFLECDWTDLVSPQILAEFKPMLERRRKRHDEKDAREEKERIRIEKAEERELAAIRRKRPSIPNDAFFTDSLPILGSSATQPEDGSIGSSPPWANRSTAGFASLASPGTSPTMQRTVWGTAAVAPTSAEEHAALPRDDEFRHDADDGWLQGWEKDLLDQRDHLALEGGGVSLSAEAGSSSKAPATGGGGGKKGKKNKKITLMSTATSRRGA